MCDYVISATRGEGVGLPMLEGNYFGKPIIAHDQGVFQNVRHMVSTKWHVIPSREIPIDLTGVPAFLHKVFHGTWWDVSEESIIETITSLIN
jgi:glycosyltransferase involved in cell wall biosynthesis